MAYGVRLRACLAVLLCLMLPLHAQGMTVTDGTGSEVLVSEHPRTVVLLGSYARAYQSAGGQLVGVTSDFFEDGDQGDIASVGTAHQPSLEAILTLDPELVVLSSLHTTHLNIGETLRGLGIPCLYYQVTRYEQYLQMLDGFCRINGTPAYYQQQRALLQDGIEAIIRSARADARYGKTTCLLLRVYATGIRSKAEGTIAGEILKDMGLANIASGDTGADLMSMEAIITADPDYIFVVAMGEDEAAASVMAMKTLYEHPGWAGLTAVREGRVFSMEKRLFHNKPNEAWAQAYAWVAATVYGR